MSFIVTSDGQKFFFDHPEDYTYDVKVIAASLSKLCRFTGHTNRFYSVAEHSIIVSRLVPRELALVALFHDAHEAFTGDISTPYKALLKNAKSYERETDAELYAGIGLAAPRGADALDVKEADLLALAIEAFYLLPPNAWLDFDLRGLAAFDILDTGIHPACMPPAQAERAFLERYVELKQLDADGGKPGI